MPGFDCDIGGDIESFCMRNALLAGVATAALAVGMTGAAHAQSFSGSGSYGALGPNGQEPWVYGANTPIITLNGASTTDVGWGSPGISNGLAQSAGSSPLGGFEITFTSANGSSTGIIDPAQIAQGQTVGCSGVDIGGEGGGSVFCVQGPNGWVAWTPSYNSTTGTLTFTAPSSAAYLDPNGNYFVDIMLLTGNLDDGFAGTWATPEPASLTLFGSALVGLGAARRRRRRRHGDTVKSGGGRSAPARSPPPP